MCGAFDIPARRVLVGSVIGWQIGVCISFGSDCALTPLKSRSRVGSSTQSKFCRYVNVTNLLLPKPFVWLGANCCADVLLTSSTAAASSEVK